MRPVSSTIETVEEEKALYELEDTSLGKELLKLLAKASTVSVGFCGPGYKMTAEEFLAERLLDYFGSEEDCWQLRIIAKSFASYNERD